MPRVPGTRRWLKMGVELEGAWENRAITAEKVKGAEVHHDGSVKQMVGDLGEIVTRPHSILDHLCKDVVELYPRQVNASCGMHIHTSFSVLDYSILADDVFYDYFRERWEKWGTLNGKELGVMNNVFWDRWYGRLMGTNGRLHSANKRDWLVQLKDDQQELRYTALNFSAWHKYQTLENRLLPMMPTAELAVSAIKEMSDIYDTFLNSHEYPEIKLERSFKDMDGVLVEEHVRATPDNKPWVKSYQEKDIPAVDTAEVPGQWTSFQFKKKGVRDYLWLHPEDDQDLEEEAI